MTFLSQLLLFSEHTDLVIGDTPATRLFAVTFGLLDPTQITRLAHPLLLDVGWVIVVHLGPYWFEEGGIQRGE